MIHNGNKDNHFLTRQLEKKLPFESLYRINVGQSLDEELAYESLRKIFKISKEDIRTSLMSALLNGVMVKGPDIEEVVGLLKAALSPDKIDESKKPRVVLPKGEKLLGYAGSGKKGFKTMNISTPAALLAASCGVYIAKACSGATSSIMGSSDLITELGIKIDIPLFENLRILRKCKIAFFSMEKATPRFARLYAGRFFVPHALSFALAGLSLPVKVDHLLYGLAHPNIQLSARVFQRFGYKNVFIVTTTEDGIHYIDEFGISGTAKVVGVKEGVLGREMSCLPKNELDLPAYSMNDIRQLEIKENNCQKVIDVLLGRGEGARIDVVCANAGILLYLAGKAKNLLDGYRQAKYTLKKGKAIEKLYELIKITKGDISKIERFL